MMPRKVIRKHLLSICILASVIVAFILGLTCNKPVQNLDKDARKQAVMLISFVGDVFIRLLKLIIVPLVVTSIIMAVSKLDTRTTGKLGRRTVIYYLTTTLIAVSIGIILVVSIRPGDHAVQRKSEHSSRRVTALDSILDMIRNSFPDNIVETTFRMTITKYKREITSYRRSNVTTQGLRGSAKNLTNFVENTIYDPWSINANKSTVDTVIKNSKTVSAGVEKADRVNVLGLIVLSLAFGIILNKLADEGEELIKLFATLLKIVMALVNAIMWTSPFGICSLITAKLVEMEDIGKEFKSLAFLILTGIIGISIQAFVVYPLIYYFIVRKNPFRYMYGLRSAMVTAFGIDSSAAALPVTIKCVHEVNKVDSRVAHFVLPIGATVNMDGTALYQAVCCIFIGQLNGYDVDFGEMMLIGLTAAAVSVGTAAVPSAGLATLVIILEGVGLPTADIGLLYAIDWFVDRFRTTCNITGDAFGAAIVEKLSKDDLEKYDFEEPQPNDNHNYKPSASNSSQDLHENEGQLLAEISV